MLGSQYYAEHPLYPDGEHRGRYQYGRDEYVLGRDKRHRHDRPGTSTLDEVVDAVAKEQGRVVKGDPGAGEGIFLSVGSLQLCEGGVPAFDPNEGIDYVGKPEGYHRERLGRPAAGWPP